MGLPPYRCGRRNDAPSLSDCRLLIFRTAPGSFWLGLSGRPCPGFLLMNRALRERAEVRRAEGRDVPLGTEREKPSGFESGARAPKMRVATDGSVATGRSLSTEGASGSPSGNFLNYDVPSICMDPITARAAFRRPSLSVALGTATIPAVFRTRLPPGRRCT